MIVRFLVVHLICLLALAGPSVWAQAVRPYQLTDTEFTHRQPVEERSATYELHLGGTLDEFNTQQFSWTTIGYTRAESAAVQPNKFLMIENTGSTNLVNPRLVVNGRRDWNSVDTILGSILDDDMTDAEKALAIYHHTADFGVQTHDNNSRVGPELPENRDQPSLGTFRELADPVKAATTYYSTGCSTIAANFAVLAERAGLEARVVWLSPAEKYKTHSIVEVFYDQAWHVFDPDSRTYFLERDNQTVASYESLRNDRGLYDRMHLGGFASPGVDKDFGTEYVRHPGRVMPIDKDWTSTLSMTLRPGEKFVYRWDDDGKFRWGNNPRNPGLKPVQLSNSKIIYEPPLDDDSRNQTVFSQDNVRAIPSAADGSMTVQPATPGTTGSMVYRVESAYPILGGVLGGDLTTATVDDRIEISVSKNAQDWVSIVTQDQPGSQSRYGAIDDALNAGPSEPIYDYYIKVDMIGAEDVTDAVVERLYFESDVQLTLTALPSLSLGANTVVYRDDSPDGATAQITHGWDEYDDSRPPLPPQVGDLHDEEGTLRLDWTQGEGLDARVVDYHIQVSSRDDMRFPVSPNFDRQLFSERTQWELPPDQLVAGTEYYWRVRSFDDLGVWSEWSDVWSFSTAVPEPSGVALMVWGWFIFTVRGRRCSGGFARPSLTIR